MRTSRYLLSEAFCPWISVVAALARVVERNRGAIDEANPFLVRERQFAGEISKQFEIARRLRDGACEYAFNMLFGG
jgi:hypothetical protein